MPHDEDRAPLAPLPLQGRSSAVAVGAGDMDGEAPALAVVSFRSTGSLISPTTPPSGSRSRSWWVHKYLTCVGMLLDFIY
jgi:hypothetical protein